MHDVQTTCAELARYRDHYVSKRALHIARCVHEREIEHDNAMVEKDALLSTANANLKVVKADNRRLRAQLNMSQDMQFGRSSERSGRRKKDDDDSEGSPAAPNPDDDRPNIEEGDPGGTEAVGQPKPRGMQGKQAVEVPSHLPRDLRVIEPEHGAIGHVRQVGVIYRVA